LIWLQAGPGDSSRYSRYLKLAGTDAEVEARMNGLRSTPRPAAGAHETDVGQDYTEINNGQTDAAEADLKARLAEHPQDANLLGAMGVLRLRQSRFADAETLLREAQARSPAHAGRWRDALRAATFWRHVQAAQAAHTAGDDAAAGRDYAAAYANPPADAPEALRSAYADVLIELHQDREAEAMEREVLRHSPDNPDALRGLITILARNGRRDEALSLANRAPAQVQGQLSGLRADDLRAQAAAAKSRGDLDTAQQDLEQALLVAPESPWVRLDLAAVYRAKGRPDQAKTLVSGLLVSNGDLPEVRMAQAYADGEAGDWGQVLSELEALPLSQRDAGAYALQRRAWVNYQLQRAHAAIQAHEAAEAYSIIGQAADAAGDDPALVPAVATAWAELGDPGRAIAAMRRAMARGGANADPALRVQYAGMLLSAGQDGEFEVVADDLATRAVLTSPEQQQLDTLIVGYRVKLADRARQAGNLSEAYVELRDVVARFPDDPRVQMALARLFTASGDTEQASAIYRSLVAQSPQDQDSQLGLVDARLAASDQEGARSLIKAGLQAHPDDPRWWQDSARLAESEGRRGDALADYRRADALKGAAAPQLDQVQPPQLAWIDPSRPGQALPAPISDVLAKTAPSTGPLRPRASEVALPPQAGDGSPEVTPYVQAQPSSRMATQIGGGEHSAWLAPPARPPVRLQSAPYISSAELARVPAQNSGQVPGQAAPADMLPTAGTAQAAPRAAPGSDAARLEADTSGWVGGELAVRTRAGQAGLSQLSDIEVPLLWRSRETTLGRLGVDVTPVYLDAGTVSGRDAQQYGTLALISNNVSGVPTSTPATSSASGVAFDLNYHYGLLDADIGTSPLGFEEQRLVGGVKLRLAPGNWRLSLDLSRRAVSESLLAYAGEVDPLTGRTWGGVSRTGGRGDVVYDVGNMGLYANAGFYTLDGHNVDSNTEISFGAGVYAHAWKSELSALTYGLNLTAFGYDKNLSFFSFGQGGYFSPKQFIAVTVPVEWNGQRGAFSYDLKGALGVQSFREDGNVFYPGFGNLQGELEKLPPSEITATGYPSNNTSGLAYSFGGVAEYRMLPRLSIGGQFGIDNAHDYREMQLLGYLRYYFDTQLKPPAAPTPIKPFYGQ
jgi:predicted Zn-dependent protease